MLFGLLKSWRIVQEFSVKVQKGNENLSPPKCIKLCQNIENGLTLIQGLEFLISVSSIKGDQLLPVPDHRAELWSSSRIEGVFLQHFLLPKAAGWRKWSGGTLWSEALDQSCWPFFIWPCPCPTAPRCSLGIGCESHLWWL